MIKKLYSKVYEFLEREDVKNWSLGFGCGIAAWCFMWEIAWLVQYLNGLTFAWIPR